MPELSQCFAILDIAQTPIPTGVIITITTSVPCHLTLYWTSKVPRKHPLSRTIRGKTVPWSTYFCFVAWTPVEQDEEGDTIYHSFTLVGWKYCTTRWFTFRGTIAGEQSPSVGPVFKKHLRAPPVTRNFIARASDGHVWNLIPNPNYTIAHDTDVGWVNSTATHWSVGQQFVLGKYTIDRAALFFDTSDIPLTAEILSATLTYSVKNKYGFAYDIVIVEAGTLTEPLLPIHYYYLLVNTTSYGSAPAAAAWQLQNIPLNALGLTKIIKGGLTKLGLRTNEDIDATPPTGIPYQQAHSAETTLKPYLTVTYQE